LPAKIYLRIRGRLFALFLGWPNSFIGCGAQIFGTRYISVGKNAYLNSFARIHAITSFGDQIFNPTINIGSNFSASDRIYISSINKVEIGSNCLLGSGVYISDHNHGAYRGEVQSNPFESPISRKLVSFGPVIIGDNVWIGNNVVIVGPVVIGDGVVIGANSFVTKDIPSNTIVAGSPIKTIKIFDYQLMEWVRVN
jgi:lipopolysaccharide O-acetyltransferase